MSRGEPIAVFKQSPRAWTGLFIWLGIIFVINTLIRLLLGVFAHEPLQWMRIPVTFALWPVLALPICFLMSRPLNIYPDRLDYGPVLGLAAKRIKLKYVKEIVTFPNRVGYRSPLERSIRPLYAGTEADAVTAILKEVLAGSEVKFTEGTPAMAGQRGFV